VRGSSATHCVQFFLGERNLALQQSLVMGAINKNPKLSPSQHQRGGIRNWVEVWDYSADTIYRGFVASSDEQKSFFVFFENHVPDQGLKSGLMALFELAGTSAFDCSQIVACLDRSVSSTELDTVVRNFGWVGFELATLGAWLPDVSGDLISDRWLFMTAEV